MIEVKAIKYRTVNSCLAAFFGCKSNEIDKIKGHWEWKDASGKNHKQTNKTAIKNIRNKPCWGWVENKEIIHYFVRKKASIEDIIGLFAHELGHMERPYHKTLVEEQKAEKYAEVSRAAYQLAVQAMEG